MDSPFIITEHRHDCKDYFSLFSSFFSISVFALRVAKYGKIDYNKLNKTFSTGVDITADYIKKGFQFIMEKAPDAIAAGKKYGRQAIETGKKYGAKAIEAGKSAIESTYKFFQDLKTK